MKSTSSPWSLWPRAISDMIIELCRSRLWSNISAQANPPVTVPHNFFGINVATSTDPQVDDYVIECLKDLGLNQVRLDYSYDSVDSYGQRLLERLIAEQFEILLNVFPTPEQAQLLEKDSTARQRWHDFITDTFQRYQNNISVFEIGSTPNRGKWSGFEPAGFVEAWKIAATAAEQYNVRLAGPNVSDFEPLYNILFLNAMKRAHSVPAIHTDNLFVERVIEPEAYDHRVLGRFAEKPLKLNLIKKARVIDTIGRHLGCEETYCTYKMWTIKRLSRRFKYPAQTQADFLSRYMVLASASGALNKVYWGPLICNRDGIIDCGNSDYPVVDNVSYHKMVRGNLADFAKRPAYDALKHITALLADSTCVQGISANNGISHYVFITKAQQEIHIAWCRNGYTLPLRALYKKRPQPETSLNSNGETLAERPRTISSSPVFLVFPANAEVKRPEPNAIAALPSLRTMQDAVAAFPDHRILPIHSKKWRGVIAINPDGKIKDSKAALMPKAIKAAPELSVMRDKRNRIWNIDTPTHGRVTVKLNRTEGSKKFTYRFRPSKGKRHWLNATAMLQRGINTPQPIAYFERHELSGLKDNYYLTAFVENAFNARDIMASTNTNDPQCCGTSTEQALKTLAEFVCRMHNNGILHRDLSAGNVLLTVKDDTVQPYLIDIGRASIYDNLSNRQRLIDVMRICYKLNWENREKFAAYYNDMSDDGELKYWRQAIRYYELKQSSKKGMKAKLKRKKP